MRFRIFGWLREKLVSPLVVALCTSLREDKSAWTVIHGEAVHASRRFQIQTDPIRIVSRTGNPSIRLNSLEQRLLLRAVRHRLEWEARVELEGAMTQ